MLVIKKKPGARHERRRSKKQIWHTAVHEAGHAVIGRVLKLDCGPATIVPDYEEATAGYAIFESRHVEELLEHWEKQIGRYYNRSMAMRCRIISIMAGAEAECEVIGSCSGGDADDRRQITFIMDSFMGEIARERQSVAILAAVSQAQEAGELPNQGIPDLRNEVWKKYFVEPPRLSERQALDSLSRWERRLRRQTARLVRRHRSSIELVAAALTDRKTLEPHEIDALLAAH
jgi:ATP-dependent Zn protease